MRRRTYTASYVLATGSGTPTRRKLRAATDDEAVQAATQYLGAAGAAAGWQLVGLRHLARSVVLPDTCGGVN
jgi:hypothetical protein